ncbi:MAG: MDR family oxidoreductase [Rhodospirillales bacterium]
MAEQNQFTALVLDESDGAVTASMETLDDGRLPEGDVTVGVEYSTLNYKDGMIVKGLGRMVREYPHVPGIDFAGTVEASDSPDYAPGDKVVLTGWRVGEVHWGGYATRARVKAGWLVPVPDGLTTELCMAIGTAGFTAMLAIMALEDHGLKPENEGEVLITGAAGGVGSIATALLAGLGYRVAASTGRAEAHEYLTDLGAAVIVGREELAEPPKGPLGSERWSGAIDNVGGQTLATALATLRYWASCASVGLASGPEVQMTVLPFLLRGVNLLGIDSGMCPKERRLVAWNRLAGELDKAKLAKMTNTESLAQVPDLAGKILQGQVRGRTVIDTRKTG